MTRLCGWMSLWIALGACGGDGPAEDTLQGDDASDTRGPDPQCEGQPNGTPCDDGRACTTGDRCALGRCAGAVMSCDDGDPCTDGTCEASSGGCVYTFNAAPCDDDDACTTSDRCAEGTCAGTPANGLACDDGDPCTVEDQCTAGVCGGEGRVCDDDNPCTADRCDPDDPLAERGTGCVYAPIEAACDDGDACTIDDACVAGACVGTVAPDHPCDDGDACTDDDRCLADGGCAGTAITCDDGDVCTQDACDPAFGCRHPPDPGTACDDGDACTLDDTCDADGRCVGVDRACESDDRCLVGQCDPSDGACSFAPRSCDDGNPCTDSACDPDVGCVHAAHTRTCDDGDACTSDDRCADGACQGAPVVCDDAQDNACQENLCDPETGDCGVVQFDGRLCNDGDLCTISDACAAGACRGRPVSCIDGDPCTEDHCDDATGTCVHTPLDPEACTSLALDRANEYRQLVDLPLLIDHEAIIDAATAHCEYYVHNPDVYASGVSAHDEVPGPDEFTGESFGQRMTAAGYTGSPLFEVIAFVDDPVQAVDEFMATLYHRIPFVVPEAYHMGYGAAREGGRVCDTINFGSSPANDPAWADLIVPFPPDDFAGVPTSWDGLENPQPPLPGPYPSGPILTVTFGSGAIRIVDSDIHGPGGPIPHVANDESGDADLCCGVVTFYPVEPIAPHSLYTVSFTYTDAGGPHETFEWSFTTGDDGSLDFLP